MNDMTLITADILERNGFKKRLDAPVYTWKNTDWNVEISIDLEHIEEDYVSTIHDDVVGRFDFLNELQDAVDKLGIDKRFSK